MLMVKLVKLMVVAALLAGAALSHAEAFAPMAPIAVHEGHHGHHQPAADPGAAKPPGSLATACCLNVVAVSPSESAAVTAYPTLVRWQPVQAETRHGRSPPPDLRPPKPLA